MADVWKIKFYVSARGIDEIETWYKAQSERVKAKFLTRLKFLSQAPRSAWKREPFDLLHGKGQGLGEIRFSTDGIQYRPLGFFSPGNVFTIVICAIERNGRFEPKDACEIALRRKKEIEENAGRSKLCGLPLE